MTKQTDIEHMTALLNTLDIEDLRAEHDGARGKIFMTAGNMIEYAKLDVEVRTRHYSTLLAMAQQHGYVFRQYQEGYFRFVPITVTWDALKPGAIVDTMRHIAWQKKAMLRTIIWAEINERPDGKKEARIVFKGLEHRKFYSGALGIDGGGQLKMQSHEPRYMELNITKIFQHA